MRSHVLGVLEAFIIMFLVLTIIVGCVAFWYWVISLILSCVTVSL